MKHLLLLCILITHAHAMNIKYTLLESYSFDAQIQMPEINRSAISCAMEQKDYDALLAFAAQSLVFSSIVSTQEYLTTIKEFLLKQQNDPHLITEWRKKYKLLIEFSQCGVHNALKNVAQFNNCQECREGRRRREFLSLARYNQRSLFLFDRLISGKKTNE